MAAFAYGIVTISDRCHRNEAIDESGPVIKLLLERHYNALKITVDTVPDEQEEIEKILLHYCDNLALNCIITTGGTGCAARDVTPEATRRVIQKEFPQLSTVMLMEGLRKTLFAALSRGVCGIRSKTLIINFPGSVKAVKECFEAIRLLIPHAIELICDMRGKTEALHQSLKEDEPKKTPSNDLYRNIKARSRKDSSSSESDIAAVLKTPAIKEIVMDNSSISDTLNRSLSSSSSSSSSSAHGTRVPESEPIALRGVASTSSLSSSISSTSTAYASTYSHVCPHKTAKAGDENDRNSPYPMVEVGDALKMIFDSTQRLSEPRTFNSPMNCPPFRASIKDGYAVKSSARSTMRKRVIGSISAGDSVVCDDFGEDECWKINTGAAVPEHADAIVQVEDTKLIKSNEDGSEAEIELAQFPSKNLDIREIGSDMREGEVLFTTNGLMDVAEKTLLASVGLGCFEQRPRIAIISTGDELQDPMSGDLLEGHIYDSNTTMLKLLCQKYNFDVRFAQIARDDYESLKTVVQSAMKECQVIISSGGVSMGDKDFVKTLLLDLKFTIHFGRVNVKPGKPMTFATLGDKSFFALPGNPVSAFVTFHLFVLPALRASCGHPEAKCVLPFMHVVLEDPQYQLDERPEYVRARVTYNRATGQFSALVTSNQMSSRIASLINADVLLQMPKRSEWVTPFLVKGTKLKAIVINQFFISAHFD